MFLRLVRNPVFQPVQEIIYNPDMVRGIACIIIISYSTSDFFSLPSKLSVTK